MNRKIEIAVGMFIVLVISSVLFLCLKVVDPSSFSGRSTYRIYAVFDNVGGLKERSPVKIGGVVIGRVKDIRLELTQNDVYKPYVTMDLQSRYNKIPSSSALMIKTSGLLGEQFVDISLGIDQNIMDDIDALSSNLTNKTKTTQEANYFKDEQRVYNTTSAINIEDLIGRFLYSSKNTDEKRAKIQ